VVKNILEKYTISYFILRVEVHKFQIRGLHNLEVHNVHLYYRDNLRYSNLRHTTLKYFATSLCASFEIIIGVLINIQVMWEVTRCLRKNNNFVENINLIIREAQPA